MDATREPPASERHSESSSADPVNDEQMAGLRTDVARAIRRVCPRWLADEAEDLTQIATARVLSRVRSGGGKELFTPGYLYRAAYSALIDEIRRRRRLREVPIESDRVTGERSTTPEAQARSREIRDALMRCLAGLAAPRRRAVILHLHGHSVAEIGQLLECSPKSAENLAYRGLADVRACLAESQVEP